MPTPKRKTTKSKSRMRAAHWTATPPTYAECPQCHQPQLPDRSEGELAKLRAAMVNMTMLAEVARELGVGEALLLGRGEELSGGRDKTSILADAMEAVFGAVYLDQGIEVAQRLIERLFWP